MIRKGRHPGWLGSLVSAAILLASCAPAPAGPPSVPMTPPYCPFDDRLVIYGGDSLATQWPRYVSLPAGYTAFNTARGGSAYSGNYTPYPDMETIGARVLAQLDSCGNDVAVVALSGGFMDLIWLVDFFGTIDLVHPNDAGYVTTAACVQPAIDAFLAS